MIIDLLGGSYPQKYLDWNNERSINWYPVAKANKFNEKDKTPLALYPRPGLSVFATITGDCVRGLFTARTLTQERCFAVVSNVLYEIDQSGGTTNRGTLTNMLTGSKSKVYMEVNGNSELMIQDAAAAYIYNLSTDTLTEITDVNYPGGKTLAFADGYLIIADNEGRVSFSELNDAATWGASNVFTPTFKADKVLAAHTFREEIYCFGEETIEIYLNDGSSPFVRQARTSLYYGLSAKDSVAPWHGGFFFVGSSRFGESEVYMLGADYSPQQISTPAISNFINTDGGAKDAEGYVQYSKDGHIFYHLHLPSKNTTLVYDATINMWHERQSLNPIPDVDGEKHDDMYRGRLHTNFAGKNLYGDWFSGIILVEDNTVNTDAGNVRKLKRISPVFNNERKYISVYQLEFDMNTGFGTTTGQGVDPVMIFKYSLDGGNTFENEQLVKLGALGEYDFRAQINGLGTARDWVLSFEITDPIDITVMQARATGTFGSW